MLPNNSLIISNTRVGDEGGYICEVSNSGGASSGVVVLTLMGELSLCVFSIFFMSFQLYTLVVDLSMV